MMIFMDARFHGHDIMFRYFRYSVVVVYFYRSSIMSIVLLCLLIAALLDVILLKKKDPVLFTGVFKLPRVITGTGLILALLVIFLSEDRKGDFSMLFLIFFLPVYLLRRHQFTRKVAGSLSSVVFLLSDALGVVVHWLYGVIVFGVLASEGAELAGGGISEMGELLLSAGFSSALIMALVYRASRSFSSGDFRTNIGLRKGKASWGKVAAIPLLVGLGFAFLSAYLTVVRQNPPPTPLSNVLETTQSAWLVFMFLVMALGIAPFVEEIVFRGYFYHVVKKWLGVRNAIYVIALTFAVLHVGQYWGDWLAIAMVTLLGFALTILRAWTGSTVASVFTHYIYNTGVTVIPVIMLAVSNPAYLEYKANYPKHDAITKETLLKASIRKQPEFIEPYNELAWLYAQEGAHLDQALDLIEYALKFAPDQPAYLDTKAEILEQLGRREEALEIRKALKRELP